MPASLLRDDADWIRTFNGADLNTGAGSASGVVEALADLLALIREGEGNYCSVNRGTAGDSPGGWAGLDQMTLAQVRKAQADRHVFAVGAYQFIPPTLAIAMSELGVPGRTVFGRTQQDTLAAALLLGAKRPNLSGYLRGKHNDLDAAHLDLAREWASIPGPDGRGVYDGDSARNRAKGSAQEVRKALQAARTKLAGRGLSDLRGSGAEELVTSPTPQYYWQRDNLAQADRTCFASSCAMLLKHCKPDALKGSNADLDFLKVVNKYGDTTDSRAQLAALAEFGIEARLVKNGTDKLIEEQIQRRGALCLGLVHRGPLAGPTGDGHWVFCYGYTPTHFVCHDPGGELDMVRGGFVGHRGGSGVLYTRRNFCRRWELAGPPWRYAPGFGWAVVVDAVL